MAIFKEMFDARTLVRLICVLSALLMFKALGAYLGFDLITALAATL